MVPSKNAGRGGVKCQWIWKKIGLSTQHIWEVNWFDEQLDLKKFPKNGTP